MIEPISCNCGKKRLNFTGNAANFKGANAAATGGMLLDGRNTREDYNTAVKDVVNTQAQFISDNAAGAKFNQLA